MKYVIFEINGIETAILFQDTIGHDEIVRKIDQKVVSAGFCNPITSTTEYDGTLVPEWEVWGKSVSLGVNARPQDYKVILKSVNFRA